MTELTLHQNLPEEPEKYKIHPTAVIHPHAQIGESVEIGPYAVIGEDVKIGSQTHVGPHAVIEFAEIGSSCQIHAHAFIGTAPQDLKYRGEKTRITIGDGTIVRECATLNRGTAQSGETKIGKHCLFMAYSHVAHDCVIEDEVILANGVAIAGHVQLGMGTIIGGLSGVHQFVKIGRLAMIGAGAMVPLDVPPFCTVWGDRAKIVGLNLEGLKRRHFSKTEIEAIKKIYRSIFFSKKPLKLTLLQLQKEKIESPVIKEFLNFVVNSARGVCRPRLKAESSASQTW
ncbi:MAG: acyl-[acyl-carrier-protein]--UDP-N-acetylglucosamine O-acyltransferase [Elusimicrobia bacterium RIFCSPLOWO2_02_FULL_39_32]|nr:MAG: acyl-[acyl-carrier-protein]--UDP-N-acetylglucosamine O-acyltransferase [Elusimicrobia bacterium GWA2_38_7]OGR79509.1 MAG: acyl-[acyl-carrier-protein]--UDP-N-acetylglucosamine O-acyltransferase [Elusimicrobia bacterium RIFCSPHIGHO2_02_FULL_39_36]OGR92835.1 MAG: acyl-[acyl-carrier-protein]--UDP-N-acetylglucosamine O-acyltransferase [Elusimicrobia bacterium RIFCSPLOWO2_02_FULL_39_32]OGR99619.1 MAG: acyl-[acyl-carrier-protein]--UDP-N-acetylglucosamine O-acyltransferase [Elusimicrobia bacteri